LLGWISKPDILPSSTINYAKGVLCNFEPLMSTYETLTQFGEVIDTTLIVVLKTLAFKIEDDMFIPTYPE